MSPPPLPLLHGRTRVRARYALMPLTGFPTSRVPGWTDAEVRVLASPELGAKFVQSLITLAERGGAKLPGDDACSTFVYQLSGSSLLTIAKEKHPLEAGGYALIPPSAAYAIEATRPSKILHLRKRYERLAGVDVFRPLVGNAQDVQAEPFLGNEHARLQPLIPDELQYDLAMNVFTFDPGHGLPYVETHVMEHGLYFLSGRGLYLLEEEWMETQADDFIYMAPYCPQSFYATGAEPAKYIYYKDVNREIAL